MKSKANTLMQRRRRINWRQRWSAATNRRPSAREPPTSRGLSGENKGAQPAKDVLQICLPKMNRALF